MPALVPIFSLKNEGRRLALERCTCITDLQLEFPSNSDQVELFQSLLLESIPKILGLKIFGLEIDYRANQQFFDVVGECIGGHQGEIEELILMFRVSTLNLSIVGLTPALRRLKVVQFNNYTALSSHQNGELLGIAADCDTLEEFGYSQRNRLPRDDSKAICQLWSRFPV